MPDNDIPKPPADTKPADKINTPKPSILDAVLASVAREENFLGGGDEARVYSFEGHDDWVVRVTDADAIASTTMLTEAYDIYDGRNLGQEIYKGVGFTINRKQEGEGPQRVIQKMYEANKARGERFPESRTLLEYWQKLANLPEVRYADLMLDMNTATKAGRTIDPNNCNYLIDFSQDPPKLGWVDIGKKSTNKSPNTVESVRASILSSTLANLKSFKEMDAEWALESAAQNGDEDAQALMALIDTAKKAITEKINKVGADLGVPATYREIEAYEHAIGAKEAVLYDEHSRQLTPEVLYRSSRPASTLGKNSFAFREGQGADKRIDLDRVYGGKTDLGYMKATVVSETGKLFAELEPLFVKTQDQLHHIFTEAVQKKRAENIEKLAGLAPDSKAYDDILYDNETLDILVGELQESKATAPKFIGSESGLMYSVYSNEGGGSFYREVGGYGSLDSKMLELLSLEQPMQRIAPTIYEGVFTSEEVQKIRLDVHQALDPARERLLVYRSAVVDVTGTNYMNWPAEHPTASAYVDSVSEMMDKYVFEREMQAGDRVAVQDHMRYGIAPEDVSKVELQHNAVYLRTLEKMLAERGVHASAEQLFTHKQSVFGAQPLLFAKDFENVAGDLISQAFKNESLTPYKFEFSFSMPRHHEQEAVPQQHLVPVMAFDVKAIQLLEKYGVPRAMVEQHMHNFMKMAQLAEHDGTAHQLLLPHLGGDINFVIPMRVEDIPADAPEEVRNAVIEIAEQQKAELAPHLNGKELPAIKALTYVEDQALAVHAQILKRMFDDTPKRKEFVLKYGAEAYDHMALIQSTALANAPTGADKKAVNEVATYLAETYYHRYARVVSPADVDLTKPVTIATPSGPKQMSVAAAAEQLNDGVEGRQLVSPETSGIAKGMGALAILEHHSDEVLGKGVYRDVHTMDSFPITYNKDRGLTQAEKEALIAQGHDATSVENTTKNAIDKIKIVDALGAIQEIRKLPSTHVQDAVAPEAAVTVPVVASSVPSQGEHITALHQEGAIVVPSRGGFRALSGAHIDAHGGGSVSLAMGVIGLNAKLAKGSEFSNDLGTGGRQALYSKASLTSDVAGVVTGGGEWIGKVKLNNLGNKISSQTLDELDELAAVAKLGKYSKWVKGAGVVGMAANVISTGFDVAAANEAGDGHRAARATGSLVGGLAGGAAAGAGVAAAAVTIATFTAAGTVVPVLGNAVGAVAGLVVVGVGAWGGSELGGMAGDAVAGDDWQAHYDNQAKQQMASVQQVLKATAEKINRNQAKADAYETAANGMYGAIKGQNIAAIQTSHKKYDRSLEALGTIEKFNDSEKKDFLASRQLLEKQLGYQLKHTQPNEKLITQLQTSLAVMDNAWLQINNYDVDFVATNKGETLNVEGIVKNDAPKMRALAAQRKPEILQENAVFKQQAMAKKWNQLQDEKNQPLIQSLADAAHVATQLTDKLQSHTLSPVDVEQAKILLAQGDPLRVQELANVQAYAAEIEKLKLQHEGQVKTDKAYAALAKKSPFPFDMALEQLHVLEQQLANPVPETAQAALTLAAQSLASAPVSQDKALMQLIEAHPALITDPALKALVAQQAAKLVSYYTQGTDAAGNDASNGIATLKDGMLDTKEMQAALATINDFLKDKGVVLNNADAAVSQPAGGAPSSGAYRGF